jgi:hypothetical protein
MQKLLNIYSSALFWLTQRLPYLLLKSKISLVSVMTLLCLVQGIESAKAANFTSDLVFITGTVGGNAIAPQSYYTNNPSGGVTTPFIFANLGTFNRSASGVDQLFINAQANTHANTGEAVSATQLLYRVYRSDNLDQIGNEIPLPLNYVSGTPSGGDAKWQNTENKQNLIEFATTPGTYTIQVYFSANVSSAGTPNGIIQDDNNGNKYVATFRITVNGDSFQTSSWNPKNNNNWFDSANWSAGNVPNSDTDVTISYQSGGTYPTINNSNPVAQARNILLNGRNPRVTLLTLSGSSLYIYGNFQDTRGSFVQTSGILGLTGKQTQSFDASATLTDVLITGGGTKNLTQLMIVKRNLIFQNNSDGSAGGNLLTRTDNPTSFGVLLDGGQLVTESENGYVLGVVTNNSQAVSNGQAATFGNVGVSLTTNVDAPATPAPGAISVTRTSSVYNGPGTSVSIRRSFYFTPSSSSNPVHDFNLVFSYLNADLGGVNANDLRLFRSESGDIPFESLAKTSNDAIGKTLTKNGITGSLNALFTLGDVNNPLPVTITSFTAVAQGADAILNWATASETNNQGFEVQVSTDGTTFSKLGFLASNNPNSTTSHSYQYRDVPAG